MIKEPVLGLYCREDTYDATIVKEQKGYDKLFDNYKGGRILDIGANIGAFARWATDKHNASEVICYEPDPDNCDMIRKNYIDKPIVLVPYAVGAYAGKIQFMRSNSFNKGIGSTWPRGRDNQKEKIIVNVLDFQKELFKYNPELIKCDIEGAEWQLDWSKIPASVKAIAFEVHLRQKKVRSTHWPRLKKNLIDNGFYVPIIKCDDKTWAQTFIASKNANQ